MTPFSAEDSAQTQALSEPSGFVLGSNILTLDGELPVEFLSVGDRIITRDAGMVVLRHVKVIDVECPMVWIMGGSLGHDKPEDETYLLASQKVLVRDWRAKALTQQKQALVLAESLVDGEFIRLVGHQRITIFQLVFDASHIVYVDGLELACEQNQTSIELAA